MADRSVGLLTEDMLERFRTRAPAYDRDNKFFQEDFDELKAAGYLKMTLPKELGGMGFTLDDVSPARRAALAMYAPATALAMNMHHYWVGLAADLWRSGDKSVRVDSQGRRRGRGLRRRSRRNRQRHFRFSCRRAKPSASTAATNSPAASRSAA